MNKTILSHVIVATYLLMATDDLVAQSATIATQWNKTFNFQSGWTGGDGAGTVDLKDGRVVWMFGDSLIGDIKEGKHAAGTHMINNAIAVQTLGKQPQPSQFEFAVGSKNSKGKPTAWVVPDPDKVKPTVPITNKKYPRGWFWPAGGGCLMGTGQQKKLVMFFFHVGRTDRDKGVWSFKNIGGAMLVVDNPDQPIERWKSRQIDLPFVVDIDKVELAKKKNQKGVLETTWGMSCVVEKVTSASTGKAIEMVYVFGARQKSRFNRQLLLARVPANQIEDLKAWRFYSGKSKTDSWSQSAGDAKPIAERIAAEFSIHSTKHSGKPKYILIHSDPMLGTQIHGRVADSLEGPWSPRTQLYRVPDVAKSKNYFTYAAKAHARLSPKGKLLISYVVNSQDFWEMLRDASIYRPRFIRVPVGELLKRVDSKEK